MTTPCASRPSRRPTKVRRTLADAVLVLLAVLVVLVLGPGGIPVHVSHGPPGSHAVRVEQAPGRDALPPSTATDPGPGPAPPVLGTTDGGGR